MKENLSKISYKNIRKLNDNTIVLVNNNRLINLQFAIERYYNGKSCPYMDRIRWSMIKLVDNNPKYISNNDKSFVELPSVIVVFLFKYANKNLKRIPHSFYVKADTKK